jgi:preprotein translocase subunit SecA
MAGRGTDIKLTDEARAAGGLYILGTERHESRRIDNQLRGRAGRQGDPGESRFYISLEDDLIRIFAGDTIKKRMQMIGMTEDENIESTFISKRIEDSQEKVEKHNFEIRRHLLEYDDVLNQQRTIVYRIRREVLEGESHVTELVRIMIADAVRDLMQTLVPSKGAKAEEIAEFTKVLAQMVNTTPEQLEALPFYKTKNLSRLQDELVEYLLQRYQAPGGESVTQEKLAMLQDAHKWLMLETIDQAWKQHMLNLDHLKEGISLRSWGQKNPLIEYKREAFAMFEDMLRQVRAEVVHHVFHLNMDHFNHIELERKREQELEELHLTGPEDPEGDHHHGHEHEQAHSDKTGRNEDCPCGSGKKYKKCCAK